MNIIFSQDISHRLTSFNGNFREIFFKDQLVQPWFRFQRYTYQFGFGIWIDSVINHFRSGCTLGDVILFIPCNSVYGKTLDIIRPSFAIPVHRVVYCTFIVLLEYILHLDVFKKNDKRTVYNTVYRDGKTGPYYIKRFAVNGITRDKEYDITQGTAGSKVVYFTVNPNAEAELIRVTLKPKPRLNKLVFEKDFSEIAIKGRQSMGNILTKNDIHKITLKQKGGSTLGGRQVWFDRDVLRLNYDNRGEYLGEFQSDDLILVVSAKGEYYTSNFDLSNHYNKDIMVIEKFDPHKTWSVVLYDAEQKFNYLKRFQLESSQKSLNFLGESADSRLLLMTDADFPRFEVVFGGNDAFRETLIVDAEEFIGIKSYKAKGKRLSTFEVETINELEPLRFNTPAPTPGNDEGNGEGNGEDDENEGDEGT